MRLLLNAGDHAYVAAFRKDLFDRSPPTFSLGFNSHLDRWWPNCTITLKDQDLAEFLVLLWGTRVDSDDDVEELHISALLHAGVSLLDLRHIYCGLFLGDGFSGWMWTNDKYSRVPFIAIVSTSQHELITLSRWLKIFEIESKVIVREVATLNEDETEFEDFRKLLFRLEVRGDQNVTGLIYLFFVGTATPVIDRKLFTLLRIVSSPASIWNQALRTQIESLLQENGHGLFPKSLVEGGPAQLSPADLVSLCQWYESCDLNGAVMPGAGTVAMLLTRRVKSEWHYLFNHQSAIRQGETGLLVTSKDFLFIHPLFNEKEETLFDAGYQRCTPLGTTSHTIDPTHFSKVKSLSFISLTADSFSKTWSDLEKQDWPVLEGDQYAIVPQNAASWLKNWIYRQPEQAQGKISVSIPFAGISRSAEMRLKNVFSSLNLPPCCNSQM